MSTEEEQVIVCADEQSAKDEAARRQATEGSNAEWIYLRLHGSWVAKRYVPGAEAPAPEARGWKQRWKQGLGNFAGALFDPNSWT